MKIELMKILTLIAFGLVAPVSMSPAPNPIRMFDKTIPITFSCKTRFLVFETDLNFQDFFSKTFLSKVVIE